MNGAMNLKELSRYFQSPERYNKEKKTGIETLIATLDRELKGSDQKNPENNPLFRELRDFYSDSERENPITQIMYQTNSTEKGLHATNQYKEIYFNEIIQNANDLSQGEEVSILLEDEDEQDYIMSFTYKDGGFSTKDIICFLNAEFHGKEGDLSSTGKHGVGIKSLFYFVNHLEIVSNVVISLKVEQAMDGEINEASSSLSYNEAWDGAHTTLRLRFSKTKEFTRYNVEKLKRFISLALNGEDVSGFFFSPRQTELIFDGKGLLFTDKNKNKTIGIKTLSFHSKNGPLFAISAKKEEVSFSVSATKEEGAHTLPPTGVQLSVEQLYYNERSMGRYLCFTVEKGEQRVQNLTAAFPEELGRSPTRFYETYYIPNETLDFGLNVLINTGHSNVSRTKLAEEEEERTTITQQIQRDFFTIYHAMSTQEVGESPLAYEVSHLFHQLVHYFYDNGNNHLSIFQTTVNNRYLPKFSSDFSECTRGKFIVFQRKEKEAYENRLIGAKVSKGELEEYYKRVILKQDSIVFDKNQFMEKVGELYEVGFDLSRGSAVFSLRSLLNIAGTVRDLFYYRIMGRYPSAETENIGGNVLDRWLANVPSAEFPALLSLIGLYQINEFVKPNGDMRSAPFREYLFSNENQGTLCGGAVLPFQKKQEEMYGESYRELKNTLFRWSVNPNVGDCKGCPVYYGTQLSRCHKTGNCSHKMCFYTSYRATASVYALYEPVTMDETAPPLEKEILWQFTEKLIHETAFASSLRYLGGNLMLFEEVSDWYKFTTDQSDRPGIQSANYYETKALCVDFLHAIQVDSLEEFKYYVEQFFDFLLGQKIPQRKAFTVHTKEGGIDLDINQVSDLFHLFYPYLYQGKHLESGIGCQIQLSVTGDFAANLCDPDLFCFVKHLTGYEIFLTQTTKVGTHSRSKEVMYFHKNEIFTLFQDQQVKVGSYQESGTSSQRIYIVSGDNITGKEAVFHALSSIFKGNHFLFTQFKAFISSDHCATLTTEEYGQFANQNQKQRLTSPFSRGMDLTQGQTGHLMENKWEESTVLELILARGCNHGTCSCCAAAITSSTGKLVVAVNGNFQEQPEYAFLYTATCPACKKLLEKCLQRAEIILGDEGGEEGREKSNVLKFQCRLSSDIKTKVITFESELTDGNLKLIEMLQKTK